MASVHQLDDNTEFYVTAYVMREEGDTRILSFYDQYTTQGYATKSPTFIENFMDAVAVAEESGSESMRIRLHMRTSKANRTYLQCSLIELAGVSPTSSGMVAE